MSLRVGQAIGHYRILRQLGSGGMGEVYEAEDAKLGRHVALKVLPEETARDPQMRQRFEREAKAIAALNHPNIVTIYSVEEAEGIDFMTMELIDGQTLREALPRGGMPLDRLLGLAIPLSEAVAAAHQQGITHRDLKPENVILARDGKIKVLDFGLAKVGAFFGKSGDDSRLPTRALTEEGRIVGTVAYMSPEQAEGKPVDPRSDVFTLGIMLYEMSTGQQPFRGDTAMSILSSILKENPPPVTQINATLPRDMSRIVNRCLSKDPARRFQSALGLSTELAEVKQQLDSGELAAPGPGAWRSGNVSAPAISSPAATAAPVTMAGPARGGLTKYVVAAATVVVLATAAFGTMRWWRGRAVGDAARPGSQASVAPLPSGPGATSGAAGDAGARPAGGRQRIVVLPFENLGSADDAYFSDGMTEEITSRLASVSGLGVISRNSAMQYAKTGKTTKQIGAELGVDYVLAGTVRWDRGAGRASRVRVTPQLVRVADDTQLWGDRYDREMKDIFAVQSEIAGRVVDKLGLAMRQTGGPAAESPPTQNLDAYQLYLRGKSLISPATETKGNATKGADLLEQAVRLDPRFAQGWAMLSFAHSAMYQYRYDYTEERLAKAREAADKSLALQPDLAEGHRALGYYYYWGRSDYAQATEEFRLAAGGRGDDAETLEAMGYVMRRQGRWDEAVAAMEKAYALNPRKLELVNALRETYETLRRYPEAIRFADLGLSLAPDSVGVLVGNVFFRVNVDGNTRAAHDLLKKIDRREFPEAAGIESFLDELDGRFDAALANLAGYPHDVLETQTLYRPKSLLAGFTYLAMNDRARAQASCESGRQVLEKALAASPRDPRMRSGLAMALACLGRKDEAVREAKLAADMVPVSTDAVDGPFYQETLARVYATIGERDAACDILGKLLAYPSGTYVSVLKQDPEWAPLWKFPRFQKLIAKYS
jgi:TolB-like protein/tetratricopeptide (TPR) repeat protein/tRNA A-37 threonylcarbamoyl transferase component Bud32